MKSLFILTIALILCFFALPVQGLAAIEALLTHDRPLLTLERLQFQLKAPIPSEGSRHCRSRSRSSVEWGCSSHGWALRRRWFGGCIPKGYHAKLDVSYFVEEGTLRQVRLLIGRLPIIPRFPQFRDRYIELPWDKHWNWLNYFDFSLNNFLRFGFNNIRLRDAFLPGLLTTLVWYQWSLGALYIALLLWTLSRTIPGLIY